MDNETFLACQLAIRERIKAIDSFYSRNSPQSDRAGLVQMGFALRLLARRYIKVADWPGHEVTDDVRLNWELEWYMNYIEAAAQVCKAAQIAVREKRLTLRSQLTRTPLDVAALDAWLNIDIDATLAARMKGFFPSVLKLRPAFDSWPDALCMPPGGAYIQDIAAWAAGDGLASVDDVVLLLTGIAPAQTPATPAPVVAETTEQRRVRWLDWHGTGERGAVARVYERELLLNPRADRSFIGKEINKAKNEKAKTERGGTMYGQLVQDGKRKG